MKYKLRKKAVVLLEDGTIFYGKSVGIEGASTGEICFNTGMTGYQEIFTDPSYYGQLLVTANVHIGNYGVNNNEVESDGFKISGLICRDFSYSHSRINSDGNLFNLLKKNNLVAISNVDTRALVSHIRDNGSMNAIISTDINDIEKLKNKLKNTSNMEGLSLVSKVSTKKAYYVGDENSKIKIAVLDLGIKKNILRNFEKRGAYIKIFPCDSTFEEMCNFKPNGFFISNGPGDPQPLVHAQELAKKIIKRNFPLFGICLGHQIIALANGISTYKMHNGHRGINHPVKNLLTGKGEITSQNHGFAINREETEKNNDVEITHININDNTIAGIRLKNKKVFSVQYHPESNPGPNDSEYLFDQFIDSLK